MWKQEGKWEPTNHLRFVDGKLQQKWVQQYKIRAGGCFSRTVSNESKEWRCVDSYTAEQARMLDAFWRRNE